MADYNGWANYATWRINLEIIDGTDEMWESFNSESEIAEAMEEYVDEILKQNAEGLGLDYARSFVSEVDWREIASHYFKEEIEEDEDVES